MGVAIVSPELLVIVKYLYDLAAQKRVKQKDVWCGEIGGTDLMTLLAGGIVIFLCVIL